jgi:hypothetical protein
LQRRDNRTELDLTTSKNAKIIEEKTQEINKNAKQID